MPKIIIDLSEEQYKGLKSIPYGSIASKIIYDKIKQGAVIVDGEYIKKEDTLKALHDFWDEYIGYDGSGTEMMLDNESVINSLPTYSFPDSSDIEKIRAEIEDIDPITIMGAEIKQEILGIIDKHRAESERIST